MAQDPAANELAALVRPVWSESRTRDALRVSQGELALLLAAGEVLGLVTADGATVFPVWQFTRGDDDAVVVKSALATLLRTLVDFDNWAIAVLLNAPCFELDDLSPRAWLADGRDPHALVDLAHRVRREWAAGTA